MKPLAPCGRFLRYQLCHRPGFHKESSYGNSSSATPLMKRTSVSPTKPRPSTATSRIADGSRPPLCLSNRSRGRRADRASHPLIRIIFRRLLPRHEVEPLFRVGWND